ncbi:MAG: hypothetical protein HUK16_08480 [Bacteroidales bacterium]|nr:hypothetical protein [Bacteroidales bacterium]
MEAFGNQQTRRPVGMSILLILSFIGGGFNFFSNIFTFLAFPMLGQLFEASAEAYSSIFPQEAMDNAMMMLDVNRYYYLIIALLNAVSFIGVLKMWKLDKDGLHFYAISQLCMLIANAIFLYPKQADSSFVYDLMLTGMFIIVYFLHFKRIELLDHGKDENEPNE